MMATNRTMGVSISKKGFLWFMLRSMSITLFSNNNTVQNYTLPNSSPCALGLLLRCTLLFSGPPRSRCIDVCLDLQLVDNDHGIFYNISLRGQAFQLRTILKENACKTAAQGPTIRLSMLQCPLLQYVEHHLSVTSLSWTTNCTTSKEKHAVITPSSTSLF